MHGYEVKSSVNASKIADVIVSVTGNMHALDKQHFDVMKDGVVLANAGHFDVEINLEALKQESAEIHRVRDHVESYLYDGKEILVLAEGRLVNLGNATGHPSRIMDGSFANQVLAQMHLFSAGFANVNDEDKKKELIQVEVLPKKLDEEVASLMVQGFGGVITQLTEEQADYINVPQDGPFKEDSYKY